MGISKNEEMKIITLGLIMLGLTTLTTDSGYLDTMLLC